ncbi:DUF3292 domain-containing protein, partial [Rubripirellula amarantea]|nr:DUF3292 domain-containing protein [Rubripirellula amarantea]
NKAPLETPPTHGSGPSDRTVDTVAEILPTDETVDEAIGERVKDAKINDVKPDDIESDDEPKTKERFGKLPEHLRKFGTATSQQAAEDALRRVFGGGRR